MYKKYFPKTEGRVFTETYQNSYSLPPNVNRIRDPISVILIISNRYLICFYSNLLIVEGYLYISMLIQYTIIKTEFQSIPQLNSSPIFRIRRSFLFGCSQMNNGGHVTLNEVET